MARRAPVLPKTDSGGWEVLPPEEVRDLSITVSGHDFDLRAAAGVPGALSPSSTRLLGSTACGEGARVSAVISDYEPRRPRRAPIFSGTAADRGRRFRGGPGDRTRPSRHRDARALPGGSARFRGNPIRHHRMVGILVHHGATTGGARRKGDPPPG